MAVRCLFRLNRVTPAEIVQPCHEIEAASDGYGVSDRFVHGAAYHVVRVDVAVSWAYAVGHDEALHGFEVRPYDSGIARAIVMGAGERFYHAAALYLVVVLPYDIFLAADIVPGKDAFKRLAEV